MSDPKEFLTRWSRRKLDPDAEKAASAEKAPLPAGKAAAPSAPEPEFDITTLPSLESIGANSDIRAFLQRGVPQGLTRAALRRAWSADLAIRDFVGLSENSWDFNAPDSMPGFGSLDADEVRRIAARFFGERDEADQESPDQAVGPQPATPVTESAGSEQEQQAAGLEHQSCESDKSVVETKPPAEPDSLAAAASARGDQQKEHAAVQHRPEDESRAPPRRHGGALPK